MNRYHGFPTVYQVLGVDADASLKEIHTAGRRAAAAVHPDRAEQTPEAIRVAIAKFLTISEARACLSDPARRSDYDRRLRDSLPLDESPESIYYGDDDKWASFEFKTPTVRPLLPWRPRLRSRHTFIGVTLLVVGALMWAGYQLAPAPHPPPEDLTESVKAPLTELIDPGEGAARSLLWSGAAPYESALIGTHPGFSQLGFLTAGDRVDIVCFAHGEDGPVMAYVAGEGYVGAADLIDLTPRDQTASLNGQACLGNESDPATHQATSAANSVYPIYSEGAGVAVRAAPRTSAGIVGDLSDGDFVTVIGVAHGTPVVGVRDRTGATTPGSGRWDLVASPVRGWIPDVDVLSGRP